MKNKVVVIIPVILVWIFVIIGCVMLPRKPSESDEEKKEEEYEKEKIVYKEPYNMLDNNKETDIKKEFKSMIFIDASHSPYVSEGTGMQEETVGETLSRKGKDISEYKVTYELANSVSRKLKKSDIQVIVIQERNKEKIHLIEQFEPDMVVTLHVHNTSEEKEKVYYKENAKSKEIVKKMFDPINDSFQVKSKKTKKGSILKDINQAFIVEYNAPEDVKKEWIDAKAKELSEKLKSYYK